MKDNSTTTAPEAWKMRFLANGASGTRFYTGGITVIDAWLRTHPDDVEVVPLCRIPPRRHSHKQHVKEPRVALARMLHMHHMILRTTHYRENITGARCTHEMRGTPLQALDILARYPRRKDEVWRMRLLTFWLSSPFNVSSGDTRQPTLTVHSQAFHTERTCRDVLHAIKKEDVGGFSLRGVRVSDENTEKETESS